MRDRVGVHLNSSTSAVKLLFMCAGTYLRIYVFVPAYLRYT